MDKVEVVYDKDCPVCDYYCQRVDVDESFGTIERIDARERSDILDEITDAELDIDEGMVVKVGETIYYGSDAIHKLATLSSQRGFVNKVAYAVFRHPRAATMLYPLLAQCRNLLLKLLGRSRINNLQRDDNSHF